jgi:protein TonB
MEPKKSPKVDLKNKRLLFTEIGLIISLSLCLVAFEWHSEVGTSDLRAIAINGFIEPDVIATLPEPKPPEPPDIETPEPKILDIEFTSVPDDFETKPFSYSSEFDNNPIFPVIFIPEHFDIKDETPIEVISWVAVEKKPEFPGGEKALLKYISENVKYPAIPKDNGIQGKVFVLFVIDKNGKVTNVEIGKGVDKYLDEEAIKVVANMPDWIPGKQMNKNVSVSYMIPINFKLF